MDYLEGFLIGSVWSDTDYRSRRHVNAHVLLAAAMGAVFACLTLFPEQRQQLILIRWPASLALLIFLVILTPIISIFYRRLPFFVRPLVILIYAFKYLLLFYVLLHYFLPLVTLEKDSILTLIFARMDGHIETSLDVIAKSGGILATVGGVVVGGLWVIGEGLAILATLVLVPLAVILPFKGLQYGLDYLVKYVLDRQLAGISPALVVEKPWQGELVEEEEIGIPLPAEKPVMAKTARQPEPPKPVPVKKDVPVKARAPRRKGQFKKQLVKIWQRIGESAGRFAVVFMTFTKAAGKKIKETAKILKDKVEAGSKKKSIRKTKLKLSKDRPADKKEKEQPDADLEPEA